MSTKLTYKKAGVDIDKANQWVRLIGPMARMTKRAEVLSGIGHYAGLFALPPGQWREPVLVSSTDGVGTKLKLAIEYGEFEGLGQDLVAMSANDILCLGAEPLFFLDYLATGHLNLDHASKIVSGIAKACRQIHCSLLGGETAEMPSLYSGDDFDLAGFIVGVVEKQEIIDGSKIKAGHKIIGLGSSGLHSNGFSLVHKIIKVKKLSLKKKYPPLGDPLGEVLLRPTRLYGNIVSELRRIFPLYGIDHITGGGVVDNLPRLLPENVSATIRKDSWPRPVIFRFLQEWGHIEESEMLRVFNCGIGLMLVVADEDVSPLLRRLQALREPAWVIGEIIPRAKSAAPLRIL